MSLFHLHSWGIFSWDIEFWVGSSFLSVLRWLLWEIFSQSNSYSGTGKMCHFLWLPSRLRHCLFFPLDYDGFHLDLPCLVFPKLLQPTNLSQWIGKFSVIIPSKSILFSITISSFSPLGSNNKHIRPSLIVPQVPSVCLICFNLLSVCFSDQVTSIYPSSTSWTFSGHLCFFEDRLHLSESLSRFFVLDNVFILQFYVVLLLWFLILWRELLIHFKSVLF